MNELVPPSGALRTWVELYGPLTEAHDNAHLGAAIALISAAIGWRASIRWAENAEPCTVNVILEGRSATARKTTVAASAHSLARSAMDGTTDPQLITRSLSHTSSRGLIELVAPSNDEQAEDWETTPPPGVFAVWDEFGQVLGDPGDIKGSSWIGQIRSALMQIANGRHGGLQTGGAKTPGARCAISILATMTRIELEQRVSTGLLRDGFMGRFVLIPYPGRARLLAEPPKWTRDMQLQRDSLVEWLRALTGTTDVIGDVFARLTPEARELRRRWYGDTVTRLDAQAEANGTDAAIAAVEAFGRLQTTALKVATVAAVSDWTPPARLSELEIAARHVDYGQRLAELCLDEVDALGRDGGHPRKDQYAVKALDFLRRRGATSRKDLLDRVHGYGLSRIERWAIIESLYPDVVNIVKVETGGRPGLMVSLQAGSQASGDDIDWGVRDTT